MAPFLTPLFEGLPEKYWLRNARSGLAIATRLLTAFDSSSRRTGLLHHTSLPEDTALIIAPSSAIHTFFMKFPIDVAFVTKRGEVLKARHAVPAWRMTGSLGAYAVIELSAGALRRSDTQTGDAITLSVHGSDSTGSHPPF